MAMIMTLTTGDEMIYSQTLIPEGEAVGHPTVKQRTKELYPFSATPVNENCSA